MITLVTTEIELSQDDIKQAIIDYLYQKDIINNTMQISFWDNKAEYTNLTAKVTFTK